MRSRTEQLAWEARWAMPTALVTFAALGFLIASVFIGSSLGGGGEAESLRDIHDRSSSVTLVSVLQCIGFALLVAPLVYLFRATMARSERVRSQFLPLVIAAPLALGVAAIVNGVSLNQAATTFVDGEASADLSAKQAKADCRDERSEDADGFREDHGKGDAAISACATEMVEDDAAENAITDTSARRVGEGVQFGGLLGLAFALAYTCLYAMRAGLLTRFWGSLGIAVGVASVFGLLELSVVWFIYFGLLVAGLVPGGRPPAWAAGEAIPWPSPGEKMAGLQDEGAEDGMSDGDERDG